jgi:hypothetical protein
VRKGLVDGFDTIRIMLPIADVAIMPWTLVFIRDHAIEGQVVHVDTISFNLSWGSRSSGTFWFDNTLRDLRTTAQNARDRKHGQ